MMTEQEMANVGPRELKEPGSPAWCWQTVSLLQNLWGSIDSSVNRYEEVWETAEEYRIWETIPYEAPYGSVEVMKEKLMVGDAAEARARTALLVIQAQPTRKHGSDYIARIKRDHPDIAQQMERGEFKSVAAAARAAGIYSRTKTITASRDKGKLASSLLEVYGVDGCQELITVLRQVMEVPAEGQRQGTGSPGSTVVTIGS